MKVAFGSDHAGFELKRELVAWAESAGHRVTDLGNAVFDPGDDYPDFARAVAVAVSRGEAERGIVVCGLSHRGSDNAEQPHRCEGYTSPTRQRGVGRRR